MVEASEPVKKFLRYRVALIIVGAVLATLSRREYMQHGQPSDPDCPTSKLVTAGGFSISRNLLYLGGVCIVVKFECPISEVSIII